ncbi:hypothetical protein ACOMHN_009535 [Nucella lapillus]
MQSPLSALSARGGVTGWSGPLTLQPVLSPLQLTGGVPLVLSHFRHDTPRSPVGVFPSTLCHRQSPPHLPQSPSPGPAGANERRYTAQIRGAKCCLVRESKCSLSSSSPACCLYPEPSAATPSTPRVVALPSTSDNHRHQGAIDIKSAAPVSSVLSPSFCPNSGHSSCLQCPLPVFLPKFWSQLLSPVSSPRLFAQILVTAPRMAEYGCLYGGVWLPQSMAEYGCLRVWRSMAASMAEYGCLYGVVWLPLWRSMAASEYGGVWLPLWRSMAASMAEYGCLRVWRSMAASMAEYGCLYGGVWLPQSMAEYGCLYGGVWLPQSMAEYGCLYGGTQDDKALKRWVDIISTVCDLTRHRKMTPRREAE